jgi:hypothetical protein
VGQAGGSGNPFLLGERPGSALIRTNQQFAVVFAAVREFLLGPFLVTAPLRRHLGHNPQSRFLRSRWLAFRSHT